MNKLVVLVIVAFAFGCGEKKKKTNEAPKAQPKKQTRPHFDKGKKRLKPKRKRLPKREPRKAKKKLPKEYHQLLRKGRALERQGKHDEAMATFNKALKVVPDDARVLAELSWAALHAKKYDRATAAAKRALAAATRNRIKAQALYNLGRIHEANNRKPDALRAYHRSQVLRPHKEVAARIKKLAGKGPAMIVTPLPAAPAGRLPKFDLNEWWGEKLDKPESPFLSAFVQENDNAMCDLYMRVGRKWITVHKVADCPGNNKYWRTSAKLSMTKMGKQPLLRVDIEEGERDYRTDKKGIKSWQTKLTRTVLLCGLGKSKEVSCTPRIVVERSVLAETKGAKPKIAEERTIKLGDGKLTITEKGTSVDHPLTFR